MQGNAAGCNPAASIRDIDLPRNDAGAEGVTRDAPSRALQDVTETILVVDDDDDVRVVVAEILSDLGYRVAEAASAGAAYDLAHTIEHLDLVLTDVVMPQESGPQLAARLRKDFPTLKIFFISGYRQLHGLAGERVLAKPFTADALACFIARGLGRAA